MAYLDHHAATPLSLGARRAIESVLGDQANPSSIHAAGRRAREHVETARAAVAVALGCDPAELVLVSGGTEAVNLAIASAKETTCLATTTIEHPAVSRALSLHARRGSTVIPMSPEIILDALDDALERGARFVAVQWVNHETGLFLPIDAIAARCRRASARLFVDATQALGKLPMKLGELGVDLCAVSSAKMGGPLGAGALFVRRGIEIDPLLVGGMDERGRRAGSPGLLAVTGFGAAASEVPQRLEAQHRIAGRRDELERGLLARGAVPNHTAGPRVATVTNVSFRSWRGPLLVAALDLEGVQCSSGAACSSGLDQPSPVLTALFPSEPWRASSALRLSLGPETTAADVDGALSALDRVLAR